MTLLGLQPSSTAVTAWSSQAVLGPRDSQMHCLDSLAVCCQTRSPVHEMRHARGPMQLYVILPGMWCPIESKHRFVDERLGDRTVNTRLGFQELVNCN